MKNYETLELKMLILEDEDVGIKESSSRSASFFIAVEASPTPGKITLSASLNIVLSSVYTQSIHPTRPNALVTERMFPVS